jgi:hypothetical protein
VRWIARFGGPSVAGRFHTSIRHSVALRQHLTHDQRRANHALFDVCVSETRVRALAHRLLMGACERWLATFDNKENAG